MEILTLSGYLKKEYGQKVYKISLSAGCSCPNRDGTAGFSGCTFCLEGVSGESSAEENQADPPAAECDRLILLRNNS